MMIKRCHECNKIVSFHKGNLSMAESGPNGPLYYCHGCRPTPQHIMDMFEDREEGEYGLGGDWWKKGDSAK